MSVSHTEPQPAAGARRPLDACDSAACDFPTEWTIAPPGASHDDGSGSGIDVRPEPEVPQMTGHTM